MRPALILLCACSSFEPPSESTVELVRDRPAVPFEVAERFEVEVESEFLTGIFDGVLAATAGRRLRLQLFPDVGGKLLDLEITPTFVTTELTGGDRSTRDPRSDDLEPLHCLAIAMLEHFTPISPDRVRGERESETWLDVEITPVVPGGTAVAAFDAERDLASRSFAYRGREFSLTAHGQFEAPGLSATFDGLPHR